MTHQAICISFFHQRTNHICYKLLLSIVFIYILNILKYEVRHRADQTVQKCKYIICKVKLFLFFIYVRLLLSRDRVAVDGKTAESCGSDQRNYPFRFIVQIQRDPSLNSHGLTLSSQTPILVQEITPGTTRFMKCKHREKAKRHYEEGLQS